MKDKCWVILTAWRFKSLTPACLVCQILKNLQDINRISTHRASLERRLSLSHSMGSFIIDTSTFEVQSRFFLWKHEPRSKSVQWQVAGIYAPSFSLLDPGEDLNILWAGENWICQRMVFYSVPHFGGFWFGRVGTSCLMSCVAARETQSDTLGLCRGRGRREEDCSTVSGILMKSGILVYEFRVFDIIVEISGFRCPFSFSLV